MRSSFVRVSPPSLLSKSPAFSRVEKQDAQRPAYAERNAVQRSFRAACTASEYSSDDLPAPVCPLNSVTRPGYIPYHKGTILTASGNSLAHIKPFEKGFVSALTNVSGALCTGSSRTGSAGRTSGFIARSISPKLHPLEHFNSRPESGVRDVKGLYPTA